MIYPRGGERFLLPSSCKLPLIHGDGVTLIEGVSEGFTVLAIPLSHVPSLNVNRAPSPPMIAENGHDLEDDQHERMELRMSQDDRRRRVRAPRARVLFI